MSTITKEFTKEQLQQIIETDHVQCGEASSLARIALESLEAEPVVSHIGSKNALDAIVAFIKSNRNPTLKDQNEVSERLFQDNCHGISNHVIEYIKQIGEELEELRSAQDSAPQAPVSVPDLKPVGFLFVSDDGGVAYSPADWPMKGFNLIGQIYGDVNACRAAMLQGAEPVTTACKLPMQPLVIDAHGTLRFKENPIVRTLLDYATEHGYGLNEIAREEFDAEDQMHLAQLIGYSLSGYGTLSYVTDESYERAAAAAPQQEVK